MPATKQSSTSLKTRKPKTYQPELLPPVKKLKADDNSVKAGTSDKEAESQIIIQFCDPDGGLPCSQLDIPLRYVTLCSSLTLCLLCVSETNDTAFLFVQYVEGTAGNIAQPAT